MEKERYVPLVIAVQNGDAAAADALFGEIYQDVYYFILKTVKNSDLAADLTQDSLIEIFQTISTLRDPVAFPAWCHRIAYFRCTHYFRKKKEVLVEEDENGASFFDTLEEEKKEFIPEEALNQKDFRAAIMAMIDTLSEEQRSAVLMYYFEEFSVARIAEIQGVSEGTVKSRLNYARRAIKKSVEDYEKKTGTRLHAVGLFPLFRFLFGQDKAENAVPSAAVQSCAHTVANAVYSASAVGVTSAATVSAGGVMAGIGGKIAVGILSLAVVSGGVFGAVKLAQSFSDGNGDEDLEIAESADHDDSSTENGEFESEEFNELPTDTVVIDGNVKYSSFCVTKDLRGNPSYEVTASPAATKPDGSVTSLTIQNQVQGYRVTTVQSGFGEAYPNLSELVLYCEVVSASAFTDCVNLSSLFVGKGVLRVEMTAFYGLTLLTDISIDPTVEEINASAFFETGYFSDSSNWQDRLLVLDDMVLYAEPILDKVRYVIPDGIRRLAKDSFANTGGLYLFEQSSVYVPATVESGLESSGALNALAVELAEDHPHYVFRSIFLFRRGGDAIVGVLTHHGYSDFPNDGSVTTIGKEAYRFADYVLTRIHTLPDSLITVEDGAFKSKGGLRFVALPENLKYVGREAFVYTGFESFSLPHGIESIGAHAFDYCNLTGDLVIPNTVRHLERDENGNFLPIFKGNHFDSVTLEKGNPLFEGLDENEVIRMLLGE